MAVFRGKYFGFAPSEKDDLRQCDDLKVAEVGHNDNVCVRV